MCVIDFSLRRPALMQMGSAVYAEALSFSGWAGPSSPALPSPEPGITLCQHHSVQHHWLQRLLGTQALGAEL